MEIYCAALTGNKDCTEGIVLRYSHESKVFIRVGCFIHIPVKLFTGFETEMEFTIV